MAGILDELAPLTVGAERLKLALGDPLTPPRAFHAVDITVDYALCEPEGIVLPLELTVTGPSTSKTSLFRLTAPSVLSVLPDRGGRWIVTLRELFHNQWWGRLAFDVQGEDVTSG